MTCRPTAPDLRGALPTIQATLRLDRSFARQMLARHMAEELATGGDKAFFHEIKRLNRALKSEGAAWRISEVAPR